MTQKENDELYRTWNKDSYKILCEKNIRLAIKVANSFQDTGIEDEDLLSIAIIGLIKSAKKFNPNMGYKFSSYAVQAIRNEILMEIRKNSCHPYPNESINEIIYSLSDKKFVEKGDLIPDSFDMEEFIIGTRLEDIIDNELNKQSTRNKKIITLYLDGTTQQKIGSIVGVSQTLVSRVINSFRDKVRDKYMK